MLGGAASGILRSMFVVTINQRDSREVGDLVDDLIEDLADVEALVPFQRGRGDETQGVLTSADAVVEAALLAMRLRRWHVGIGIGPVELPEGEERIDLATCEGPGLVASRQAVNRAQKPGERVPLAVTGPVTALADEAEAVLRLTGMIVATRTEAEWRVLDLLVPGVRGQQKFVAEALHISTQAVSKASQRSHWTEEQAIRPAAARLLALADGSGGPRLGEE